MDENVKVIDNYSKEDLTIHELLTLIKTNNTLKRDLMESHILFITVGYNDLLYKMSLEEDISIPKLNNIIDAGSIFYEDENIYAGASGPVCLPLVLFDHFIKMNEYKKILVIGTGSLHSIMSCNLKLAIPSIAHAVSLEVKY